MEEIRKILNEVRSFLISDVKVNLGDWYIVEINGSIRKNVYGSLRIQINNINSKIEETEIARKISLELRRILQPILTEYSTITFETHEKWYITYSETVEV